LLLEILAFVKLYDKCNALFCKVMFCFVFVFLPQLSWFGQDCQLESRSLHFLRRVGGFDGAFELPLLAECHDLVELLVGRELCSTTFNVFVKELPFEMESCCAFHVDCNRPRLGKKREMLHCALQDARTVKKKNKKKNGEKIY
jgi:hypothetical protein